MSSYHIAEGLYPVTAVTNAIHGVYPLANAIKLETGSAASLVEVQAFFSNYVYNLLPCVIKGVPVSGGATATIFTSNGGLFDYNQIAAAAAAAWPLVVKHNLQGGIITYTEPFNWIIEWSCTPNELDKLKAQIKKIIGTSADPSFLDNGTQIMSWIREGTSLIGPFNNISDVSVVLGVGLAGAEYDIEWGTNPDPNPSLIPIAQRFSMFDTLVQTTQKHPAHFKCDAPFVVEVIPGHTTYIKYMRVSLLTNFSDSSLFYLANTQQKLFVQARVKQIYL